MTTQLITAAKMEQARKLMAERGLTKKPTMQLIGARLTPGPAPLSHAQMRLWYHEQLHPNSALYNTPIVLELKGDLNEEALSFAFNSIVERHEVLRTIFQETDGEIVQIPRPFERFEIAMDDLTTTPPEAREALARGIAEQAVRQPFDLSKGPLFHTRLLKLGQGVWWLLILNHHIVFDGWSRSVLMQELSTWYRAALGLQYEPQPLATQYADYAIWQSSPEHKQRELLDLNWWTERLRGAPTLLALPTDRPRPPVQTFRGKTHTFVIPTTILESVDAAAAALGVTQFVMFASALSFLLHRLSGQSDIILSTGIATRQSREIEHLIGCFINVLLLRSKLERGDDCVTLIKNMSEMTLSAFAHQHAPFQSLVASLAPERDLSYNPLTQVMIVHHNENLGEAELPDVSVRRLMPEKEIAQYDLLLHLRPMENDAMVGMLEYNVDLFDEVSITRMCAQFIHVLTELTVNSSRLLDDISVLPPEQTAEILALNPPAAPFPRHRTIHSLIEERCRISPEAIAVDSAEVQLSYCELNTAANQLAHFLRIRGVRRGDIVGISLDRSVEMVTALLAVAKTGAAYVPIDPAYPLERVQFVATDSRAKVIVTHSSISALFESNARNTAIICIDKEYSRIAESPTWDPPESAAPTDLLYLIYTSGSTGTPKGVMLDHRGRVNNFSDFNRRFSIGPGDRLLAVSSLSFDMCAYDVFGSLMAGATIVLPPGGSTPNPEEWSDLLVSRKVTIWHSAPALLTTVLDRFQKGLAPQAPALRLALLGGDWIPLSMPDRLRAYSSRSVTVVSLGGATEVSMDSTIYVTEQIQSHWRSIPYGVAMANQSAFVLDSRMQLSPIGVPGELYLGGVGVGRGYLRRPTLTAIRFVPNPYSNVPGDRMYRTGDIARWTNDGQLELLGRSDFQVKLNGLRIELGEIDAALGAQPSIKAAVASVYRPGEGEPRLVAYVVPADDGFEWASVRERLYTLLPSYMVPRQCVQLTGLPLSPNGKVQRSALPPPVDDSVVDAPYTPPQNALERMLFAIWGGALGRNDFGVEQDFFEIGGTSLQAALIINRLPRRLSLVEFMRHSSIRAQAALLTKEDRPADSRIFRFPKQQNTSGFILCVAYAGGSAIVFRGLAEALQPNLSVAAVCMPSTESVATRSVTLEDIAKDCITELSDQELENITLYGHCAGTALTMEIARQLENQGRTVNAIFLAAAMPPGIASPFNMPRETQQEIVEFVAALGGTEESTNADDWKIMIREFQRDSRLNRDYLARRVANPPPPLNCPLTVVMGDDDPLTAGHDAYSNEWTKVADTVTVRTISGGHYFVGTSPASVATIIKEGLTLRNLTAA